MRIKNEKLKERFEAKIVQEFKEEYRDGADFLVVVDYLGHKYGRSNRWILSVINPLDFIGNDMESRMIDFEEGLKDTFKAEYDKGIRTEEIVNDLSVKYGRSPMWIQKRIEPRKLLKS